MIIESEDAARRFVAERCSAASFAALERFVDLLIEENQQQNLISRTTVEKVWRRHIADSAQLLAHVPRETHDHTRKWLDLGTGAGFPGVVIAIMQPEDRHVLVESRKRRVDWLTRVIAALNLENCLVEGARLQKVETFPATFITARAFAPLPDLINLSARFSTAATTWLLPKGRSAEQERDELESGLRKMFHVKQSATNVDATILVGNGRPKGGSRG